MLEVPPDRLGQLLMLQVTASTGTGDTPASIFHGAPLRDLLFKMEKVDDSKIVFLFVFAPPSLAVSQILFRLKGYTYRTLRREFPHLLRLPSLRTTAYFVSTAGNVSQETIRRDIEAQSKRD